MAIPGEASSLYIIGVTSNERMEIQYLPEQLDFQRTADIDAVKIIGRNNPKYHYTSGQKTLKLTLDFYAQTESREDVRDRCLWMESLTYNNGLKDPPENIRLVMGQIFKNNEIWAVLSVGYKMLNFNKAKGMLPHQAYVDVMLGLDNKNDFQRKDYR